MELLGFTSNDDLLLFFHRKKTEMSCIDKPRTFLNQLRDHGFVPEETYERVSRMKRKEQQRKAVYGILDWVEKNRADDIQLFWRCVFEDVMLSEYQTLKMLYRSFCDASFRSKMQSAQKVDTAGETTEGNQDPENKKTNSAKNKKRKSVCDDTQEQPGPSSQVTPAKKKKSSKISYGSPLKKGEKGDIWTWPIYKISVPVTCGKQDGMLHREKMARGEKCIYAKKRWFTPGEFESFSGKTTARNWKCSIRCGGIPLGKLIQKGELKCCARFQKGSRENKKSISSPQLVTDSDEEDEDDDLRQDEDSQPSSEVEDEDEETSGENEEPQSATDEDEDAGRHNGGTRNVFDVTCGSLPGKLYRGRFATGYCGKCVRTKTGWMTPKDFAKEGSGQTEVLWKRDIQCEGKPLGDLIQKGILRLHSVQCVCKSCKPEDPSHQENDDECWVCKRETDEDEVLVMCDSCPRSFHQTCHLPRVEDSQLRDGANWICTFCTFESCRDDNVFEQEEKSRVVSYRISQFTLECHYLLLLLCSADESQLFTTNPSVRLTNYSSFVKNPMWLRKVADTLERKGYETVGQFVSDVQLIFTNCASYHKDDADVRAVGDVLRQLFEREFTMAFNVISSAPTT